MRQIPHSFFEGCIIMYFNSKNNKGIFRFTLTKRRVARLVTPPRQRYRVTSGHESFKASI